MRLIATSTLTLVEYVGSNVPPYGILSHTWEDEEATYQDMLSGLASGKKGYAKIDMVCKKAANDGLEHVWVDTCCIDKTSSAELSEAINSMFQWYEDSDICYVYLSDLDPSTDMSSTLSHCRWFTRGWTLQELLAPATIKFFDRDWVFRGTEKDLSPQLSQITSISIAVLGHRAKLYSVPVAVRMSWAARRQTTKVEDLSYCLMGIFNINMPLIYGEGARAFRRLQEEIVKSNRDLSIFAWRAASNQASPDPCEYSGVFAASPRNFIDCQQITRSREAHSYAGFLVTNLGIQMAARLLYRSSDDSKGGGYILRLDCSSGPESGESIGILLRKYGPDLYLRYQPARLFTIKRDIGSYYKARTIYMPLELPNLGWERGMPWSRRIIDNRVSAIQICLPPGFTPYDAAPVSHRDVHDSVFFSTESTHDGWCALVMEGELCIGGDDFEVSLLFICFGWNNRPGHIFSTLADISICDPIKVSQLNETLGHEDECVIPWALTELGYFGIPVQKSVLLTGSSGNTIEFSYVANKCMEPDICKNEMLRIQIVWKEVGKAPIQGT